MKSYELIKKMAYELISSGRNPELIIIHPNTYEYLIDEINEDFKICPSNDKKLRLMGLDIVRTYDIEEEKIIVK